MQETLTDLFQRNSRIPDKGIYFLDNDIPYLSYSEFNTKVLDLLGILQKQNITKEIIIYVENELFFLEIFWAAILGSYIPVPVTISLTQEHIRKLIKINNKLNNPVILSDSKTFKKLETFIIKEDIENKSLLNNFLIIENLINDTGAGEIKSPSPGQTAFIQFSSGSTGSPKGVVLTHNNLITNINGIIKSAKLTKEVKALSWMPLTHDMGLIGCHITPYFLGIDHFIMSPSHFIRRPLDWLNYIEKHKITHTASPNFGLRHLLHFFRHKKNETWDLSSVKLIYCGAEPISAKVCKEFTKTLQPYGLNKNVIFPVYGLAEACLAVSCPVPGAPLKSLYLRRDSFFPGKRIRIDEQKGSAFVSVGKAIDNCGLRLALEDVETEEDIIGEIQIRGKNVFTDYYEDNESTQKSFTPGGWFKTGDLGFFREENLYIIGRINETLFVNGQNYLSFDLERVLENLKEVGPGRVVVCVLPYNERELITAFVVFKKQPEKFIPLYRKVKDVIGKQFGFELDHVIPTFTIPRTTSGKIQRYKLVEAFSRGEYDELIEKIDNLLSEKRPCTHGSIMAQLRELLNNKFNLNLRDDENFMERGIPSVKYPEILGAVEEFFAENMHLADLFNFPNITALSWLIYGKKQTLLSHTPGSLKRDNPVTQGIIKEVFFTPKTAEVLINTLKNNNITPGDFFLGIYAYLLCRITGETTIGIHSPEGEMITGSIIDFSKAKDTENMIECVKNKHEQYTLPPGVISHLSRGDKEILNLFGNFDSPSSVPFSLSLSYVGTNFTLYYDSGFFAQESIYSFVDNYIRVIDTYINQIR